LVCARVVGPHHLGENPGRPPARFSGLRVVSPAALAPGTGHDTRTIAPPAPDPDPWRGILTPPVPGACHDPAAWVADGWYHIPTPYQSGGAGRRPPSRSPVSRWTLPSCTAPPVQATTARVSISPGNLRRTLSPNTERARVHQVVRRAGATGACAIRSPARTGVKGGHTCGKRYWRWLSWSPRWWYPRRGSGRPVRSWTRPWSRSGSVPTVRSRPVRPTGPGSGDRRPTGSRPSRTPTRRSRRTGASSPISTRAGWRSTTRRAIRPTRGTSPTGASSTR